MRTDAGAAPAWGTDGQRGEKPGNRFEAADELRTLAREVSRLTAWTGDPEAFVLGKEGIARALRRMARRLEAAG